MTPAEADRHGDATVEGAERVLLVDDTPTNLQVLYQTLQDTGLELLVAQSGEEALALARDARPQMILLDIMMPGIDGFETCRRLKADPELAGSAVIFMSALSDTSDKVRGLETGAVDYITKPFQAEEVIARVNTHLTIHRLERRLARNNEELAGLNRKLTDSVSRMRRDLDAAAKVQHALLPTTLPPVRDWQFAWIYRPCDELAGDSLNVFEIDDDHVGLYVLDVSGHGVPAALLSVMVTHTLTRMGHRASDATSLDGPDSAPTIVRPAAVLSQLNRLFPMQAHASHYFTIVYGVLEKSTGRLRYSCAGHPGPILCRADGRIDTLDLPAVPCGMIEDAEYEDNVIELEPGDRIYLHSDGLNEERDANGVQFGRKQINATTEAGRSLALEESIGEVVARVAAWRGDDRFEDDVSILAAERRADG